VFAALGADLVTNDVVAVIELVKNSYDAFATRVDVAFANGNGMGRHLDVTDDGAGMDRKTLEEAWCVVATPYRLKNPTAIKEKNTRRVAGEKGLGRLSAARLGKKIEMLTKSATEPAWLVSVDWSKLSVEETLDNCFATCERFDGKLPFKETGTRVRILDLISDWDAEQITDLEKNLARLISPFSKIEDFAIFLKAPDLGPEALPTEIIAPEFLGHPPYAIRGHVTANGEVKARYEFKPISQGKPRECPITIDWSDIRKNPDVAKRLYDGKPECGPFEFQIRAWDIGSEDTHDIAEHFDFAKGNVRKAIHAHMGISVYRDGILVLPKSKENRDWLGLDLRRVSRLTRLSTSQIVGYVSISASGNKNIVDTSDREGLARNPAVLAFRETLIAVVRSLESQRDEDRLKPGDEVKLTALLDGISADELVQEVSAIAEEDGTAVEALVRVQDFSSKLELLRDVLKTRIAYYSRLATVGTIAQMLVHEIRNRTTALGRFLRLARENSRVLGEDKEFSTQLALAENSVQSLEKLADTFAPLANRAFRRGRRDSIIEESISRCLLLLEGDIKREKVSVSEPPSTKTRAAVDPGELDTVILNLLLNSLYWIPKGNRSPELDVTVRKLQNGQRGRVTVSDSGSGVAEEDADRIFLPGVTRKPGGIGMGLTVAAELVSEYGGRLALVQPGKLGGATFVFDVPLKI
jgi:signal transduction histidine kinase